MVAAAALLSAPAAGAAAWAAPAAAAPAHRAPDTALIVHVRAGALATAERAAGLRVRHRLGALHAFSVHIPSGDAARAAARLNALPGVASVEPAVLRTFADGPAPAPDDPLFADQAAYLRAVRAPAAWEQQRGSPAVKIAVVDSGVDVNHPDLATKIAPGDTYDAVTGGTDVTDDVGHGTFVAGIAAADTDNDVGIAGAGYAADLLAVKVAGPNGKIAIDDEVAGIEWAADHGADVINLSLSGPDPSPAERAAVADAQRKGALVVAAAGNAGSTAPQYPAAYPGVVAVAATDPTHGARAAFSSYGSWVTVAAPGVGIRSTVPPAGSTFWPATQSTSGYATGDGTSYAAPIVAGEAALLEAQNPGQGLARLRAAVVASAHGYGNRGLGAGQVDFVRGLAHVPPPTVPSDVAVSGTSGVVRLSATSTAPEVAFQVGDGPVGAAVPVSANGQASTTFATWGRPNDPHTVLHAYDCTAYGECDTAGAVTTFAVDNPPARITAPRAGSTQTGRLTIVASNPAGGPLRLLVDGTPRGLVVAAPYTFRYSTSALRDGPHTLTVQGCPAGGGTCAGPMSAPVTFTAAGLHPSITALTPARISPNGDHMDDTAALHFTLPHTQRVRVEVHDEAGSLLHTAALGTLAAGAHTWTWHGERSPGARLADGRYMLALDTSNADSSKRGWVTTYGVVDTVAPSLTRPTGGGTLFYPYPDGYRDDFAPQTTLGEAGTLTLTERTTAGHVVRVLRSERPAGPAHLDWRGRDDAGHLVAAGTYTWQYALTDAAGNTRRSPTLRVQVSGKRLVSVTADVARDGAAYSSVHATAPCASAHRSGSAFAHGLLLANSCATGSLQLAEAGYTFTLPPAVRYSSITIDVLGVATHRPSELTAQFQTLTGDTEQTRYETVGRAGEHWYPIAEVPAGNHVTSARLVRASVLLDSFYAGPNGFDVAIVRLRVKLDVLR